MTVKSTWLITLAFGALFTASSIASAQPVPPVPPVAPVPPMLAPVPPMPPTPPIPPMAEIDAAMWKAMSALDNMPALAKMPNLPAMPKLAAGFAFDGSKFGFDEQSRSSEDLQRADEARQRADEAKQRAEEAKQREQERKDRVDESYQRGQEYLERAQWDRAVDSFQRIVESTTSTRIDAALYWKAYALDKLAHQADALATLGQLQKTYPQSRWLADARALELQVKQNSGQSPRPEAQSDEELKLLAIQGILHTDPEQGVPLLEKVLAGNNSPRLKERALFVLAQSNSARSREVLTSIAKGSASNPDVQRKAIQYLGVNGTTENRQVLADIYASSNDVDIKRQIIRSFMVSGDKARMFQLAQTEKSTELRQEAVRQLGVMGAREELTQMYAKETTPEIKRQIIQSLFVAGDATKMIDIANNEQNVEIRSYAIRQLGVMGRTKTGDALTTLYAKEKDTEIKRSIINGLFVQGNAEGIVALARKESDPQMKREMVSKLSLMKSKVALDYLMEILQK